MIRLASIAVVMAVASTASAQTLRADRPLWRDSQGAEELYPRGFIEDVADGGLNIGCRNPFALGVYGDGQGRYLRLDNYGAIHCAIIYGEAHEEAEAVDAFESHAWLAPLGTAERAGTRLELFALQIGLSSPRYLLFASNPAIPPRWNFSIPIAQPDRSGGDPNWIHGFRTTAS